MKIRFLAVAGVCILGAATLTGCDSKIGTAAVVNGHKISESNLNSYLSPDAKPISVSQSQSTSARAFVLQFLVAHELFGDLVNQLQPAVTDANRQAAQSAALQGNTADQLVSQLGNLGIKAKFEPLYEQTLGDYALLSQAANNDTKAISAKAAKISVVVNPRYGSWNGGTLQLSDLSKAQLPSFLKFDNALPGDAPPSQ